MNLVAKEFSILNEARGGVLVLSRGAGAAHSLAAGSVMVDDVRAAAIATALHHATKVSPRERTRLARVRADAVRSWTSADWATAFVDRLVGRATRGPVVTPRPGRLVVDVG
jgi:trehalose-6-phosphate synthase